MESPKWKKKWEKTPDSYVCIIATQLFKHNIELIRNKTTSHWIEVFYLTESL